MSLHFGMNKSARKNEKIGRKVTDPKEASVK